MKEQKVDLSYLHGKTVAILGYGNQGYEHAHKLRQSGISVIVALREGTPRDKWEQDGFYLTSIWDAVDQADVIQVW
ncbi:hypothetical protein BSNK01_30120 [Bacillaceae bacterium]